MPRKKKKNSENSLWIFLALGIILLLFVGGVAGFILYRSTVEVNTIMEEPSATPNIPSLSSYAPLFMIYRVENRIYRMNMDTLESEQVATVQGIGEQYEEILSTLTISQNLNSLYYTVPISYDQHTRYKQDVTTGQVWEVATLRPDDIKIISSDNGHSLMYVFGWNHDLIADNTGGADEFVVFDDWKVQGADWAHNGSHAMFAIWSGDMETSFYRREINPTKTIQTSPTYDEALTIAQDVRANAIALSPDDRYIAMRGFSVNPEKTEGLWVIERGTTATPIYLSETSDYVEDFSWAPNSEKVVYTGYQSNQFDILMVHVETGEITNLTQSNSVNERNPQWLPNGAIVFERDDALWLLKIEDDGFSMTTLLGTEDATYLGYRFGY